MFLERLFALHVDTEVATESYADPIHLRVIAFWTFKSPGIILSPRSPNALGT